MKSEPLRGPTPTASPAPAGLCSPIHHSVLTSLLAGQPPSNGISGLTPLPAAHLPCYFGLTLGQGWAKSPAKRRGEGTTWSREPPGFHWEGIS